MNIEAVQLVQQAFGEKYEYTEKRAIRTTKKGE